MNSLFDKILNEAHNALESNRIIHGAVVKLKKNYKNSDWFKDLPQNTKDTLAYFEKTKNNIRVSSVKEQNNLVGSSVNNNECCKVADIVEEISPANWTNVMTVPISVLEPVKQDGVNLPAFNGDTKRKNAIVTKPKERSKDVKSSPVEKVRQNQTKGSDKSRNLPTKNTKL